MTKTAIKLIRKKLHDKNMKLIIVLDNSIILDERKDDVFWDDTNELVWTTQFADSGVEDIPAGIVGNLMVDGYEHIQAIKGFFTYNQLEGIISNFGPITDKRKTETLEKYKDPKYLYRMCAGANARLLDVAKTDKVLFDSLFGYGQAKSIIAADAAGTLATWEPIPDRSTIDS